MVVGVTSSALPLAVLPRIRTGGMDRGDARFIAPLGAAVGLRAAWATAAYWEALAGLLLASGVALVLVVVRGLRGVAGPSRWPSGRASVSGCSS